jgi:nucleotidyltransferase substrate binding protein (TIGR01987 family)
MSNLDIRWEHRFANYKRAMAKLNEVMKKLNPDWDKKSVDDDLFNLSDLEIEGMIQRFEYTHELAWNVMKDYLIYQGNNAIGGSRDATREAFKMNLIANAQGWMNMIKSRNQTSHTYNEETAREIFIAIVNEYFSLFADFLKKMDEVDNGEQKDLFFEEL